MKMLSRFWLVSAVTSAALVLLIAIGLSYSNLVGHSGAVGERLILLNDLRRGALQQYFSTASAELQFWSSNSEMLQAQKAFATMWRSAKPGYVANSLKTSYILDNPHAEGAFRNLDDAGDGSAYSAIHSQIHPMTKLFVTQRGYYDVFMIGAQGDVFYSVEKEADFASNLETGPLKDSGLADVFRRAGQGAKNSAIVVSDLQAYTPSSGAPAMFMAQAMRDADGEVLGVLAFQIPTARILKIMNYTSGMGATGETYLVGQDKLMRSNSRFSADSTVLTQTVDSPTVQKALAGGQGLELTLDYRGVEVMSAYSNVQVGDTSWALLAEIDRDEIAVRAAELRPGMSGILLFFYGLFMWSLWYWKEREIGASDEPVAMHDFGDSLGDLGGDNIGG